MTEKRMPNRDEIWTNNRLNIDYQVIGIAQDADCPDPRQMVIYLNVETDEYYVRSMESWMGTNREGNPRFTFVMEV